MAIKVTLAAKTISYPQGGGHLWVYLNWAMSLRAAGCEVTWLETVSNNASLQQMEAQVKTLQQRIQPYGFDQVELCYEGENIRRHDSGKLTSPEVDNGDLLINLNYKVPSDIVSKFRKSVLVDIDPGLNQIWISMGHMRYPPHGVHLTIGETVGKPGALFPDCGIKWVYTPPPVYLPAWPVSNSPSSASFTTVTHWWGALMEFAGKSYYNGKRSGFLPFLELPNHVKEKLELAIHLTSEEADEKERKLLITNGWSIKNSHEVVSTAAHYQKYIQDSRGEFSCAKPSCVHLQNAWISDRTICYLASGKPAIVEHTGPSSFLPDSEGLFRFRNMAEAIRAFEKVTDDYDHHSRAARQLAEQHFDGEKIARRVLELTL